MPHWRKRMGQVSLVVQIDRQHPSGFLVGQKIGEQARERALADAAFLIRDGNDLHEMDRFVRRAITQSPPQSPNCIKL